MNNISSSPFIPLITLSSWNVNLYIMEGGQKYSWCMKLRVWLWMEEWQCSSNINFACLGSLLHTAGVFKYSFFHHWATILCQVNYHFLLDIITSWDKISTIFLLLLKYFSASSFWLSLLLTLSEKWQEIFLLWRCYIMLQCFIRTRFRAGEEEKSSVSGWIVLIVLWEDKNEWQRYMELSCQSGHNVFPTIF